MTICNKCGKEVESEAYGYYSEQRGFLCNSCVNLLNMVPCSSCGEHFPFDEMMEWDGDMFCKKDYGEMRARADEEDREEARKAAEEKKESDEGEDDGEGSEEKPSESEGTGISEEKSVKEESIFQTLGRLFKGSKK